MINQAVLEPTLDSREEMLPYCNISIDSTIPPSIINRVIDVYAENGELKGVSHNTPPEEFDEENVYIMHATQEEPICDIAENIRKRNSNILLIAISDGGSAATSAIDMHVPVSVAPQTIDAYIKAGLRRVKMEEDKLRDKLFISSADGEYALDPLNRVLNLIKKGVQIHLTPSELGVMCCLVENKGEYLSIEWLNDVLYSSMGDDSTKGLNYENRMRLIISRLRKKLEEKNEGLGKIIENLAGMGYRLT